MLNLLYKSRSWLAFVLICLLAACNVKSDMDNMERTVLEIESKFSRGEDISQDTSIFQARRYFNLSDDAEMKTLSALYSGCVYWQQNNFDSAMAALNEAIVTARSRKMLVIISLILVVAVALVFFLMYRATQKRATIAELNLDITRLQQESEALAETNRDNLFRKVMMVYKIFLIGENKDIDKPSFQKLRSCVCGQAKSAYDVIFDEYNKVYPDVVQRIKDNQPSLSETEFKVCILSMMPFSVKEVADMMKVSTAMVGKARTSIRKKLGMTEARGSIEEFVLEIKKG